MTARELYLWIAGVPGWTWRRHQKLTEYYGSVERLAERFVADGERIARVLTQKVYDAALATFSERCVRAREEKYRDAKVRVMTPADDLYPECFLRMDYDVPFVLTYVGNPELMKRRCVSIVGSRKSSAYGARIARKFAYDLARAGLIVVSGLAYGIDGHAHRAALDAGTPTIAVLGSGLAHVTPSSNTELAREIVHRGGLIVSEYEPEFAGAQYSYPHRNRLIAALSDGVVLAEAASGSGALYTVEHAVNQNKDVFLLPGNLDSENFAGIAECYRRGVGNFVTSPEDILEEWGYDVSVSSQREDSGLDEIRQKILDSLSAGELNYDRLFEIAGLPHSEFGAVLTDLELRGFIESRGNMYYRTGEQR